MLRVNKRKTLTKLVSVFLLVAQAGFEPAVLHFHCDENAAVGSADLTVRRTVIQHRFTLRVMRDDFA